MAGAERKGGRKVWKNYRPRPDRHPIMNCRLLWEQGHRCYYLIGQTMNSGWGWKHRRTYVLFTFQTLIRLTFIIHTPWGCLCNRSNWIYICFTLQRPKHRRYRIHGNGWAEWNKADRKCMFAKEKLVKLLSLTCSRNSNTSESSLQL